jgi:hypothetical protein
MLDLHGRLIGWHLLYIGRWVRDCDVSNFRPFWRAAGDLPGRCPGLTL